MSNEETKMEMVPGMEVTLSTGTRVFLGRRDSDPWLYLQWRKRRTTEEVKAGMPEESIVYLKVSEEFAQGFVHLYLELGNRAPICLPEVGP